MSLEQIQKILIENGIREEYAPLAAEEITKRQHLFGKEYETGKMYPLEKIGDISKSFNLKTERYHEGNRKFNPAIPIGEALDGSIWALTEYESVYLFSPDLQSKIKIFTYIEFFLMAIENNKLQQKTLKTQKMKYNLKLQKQDFFQMRKVNMKQGVNHM